jgi:hypothetical protein
MSRISLPLLTSLTLSGVVLFTGTAFSAETAAARLRGFEEVPALSSPGTARFNAVIDETAGTISWTMAYSNLNGNVTQSHLHFAEKGVNGGIFVFLCSNLGNGPAGTQACPPAPATISGTIRARDILGTASSQGIQAGDFGPVLRAIRTGTTYANIHTDRYPGGEIRGQLVTAGFVRAFGLVHTSLGQAKIGRDSEGNVVISNLGPGGNDGARITLGQAQGWGFTLDELDIKSLPIGAHQEWTNFGRVDGIDDQRAWIERHEIVKEGRSPAVEVSLDASGLGATQNVLEIYLRGRKVYSATLPAGPLYRFVSNVPAPSAFRTGVQWDKTCVSVPHDPWMIKVARTGVVIQTYDTIVTYAKNPTRSLAYSTAIQSTGAFLPRIVLRDEVLVGFGFPNRALGQIAFQSTPSTFGITDIGTSGDDGVTTHLGKVQTVDATWQDLDPARSAPAGAFLVVQATGSRNGVPGQTLGSLRATKEVDGSFAITADFSSINSPTQHLQIYRRGTLVADIPHHSGTVAQVSKPPKGVGKSGGQTECYIGHFPADTQITVSGRTFLGDELRVLAESNGVSIENKSDFALRAGGFPQIILTSIQATGGAGVATSRP